MASPRTTAVLVVMLALSLALFRTVAFPVGRTTAANAPEPTAEANAVPQDTQPEPARRQPRRPKPQRLANSVYQLRTTKTQEEQRLYDLKLYRMISQCGVACGLQAADTSYGRDNDPQAAMDRVDELRKLQFQIARHHFQTLEDYILETDFTALNDDEIDQLYQYLDLRRQIEEARENYFDLSPEEWCELAKAENRLKQPCTALVKRQFEADSAETQELQNALKNFIPGWCTYGERCGGDYAKVLLPQ